MGNKHRRHHDFHFTIVQLLYLADQLNNAAPGRRISHILQGNLRDSLSMYLLRIYVLAERQARQNTNLPAGVRPLNIGGRISFRVAKLLCQGQSVLELHIFPDHLGQDKISGTIQDAGDFNHIIGGQALADWPDNRDTAAYAGFK